MPGPLALYRAQIDAGQLLADPAQERVAAELEKLFKALCASASSHRRWAWWAKLWRRQITATPPGIYLVGAVGRGKTHLMDLFAQALSEHHITHWRVHFHHFMANIQSSLSAQQGRHDPLTDVAESIAKQYRVLCFDEFHVEDIGDAMILGELLTQLFAQGVVLVTTSNTPPDDLYADGLQRARFLPAIEQIKKHTQQVHLDAATDYRSRALTQADVYFYPLSTETHTALTEVFKRLTAQRPHAEPTTVQGRPIHALGLHSSVAWFEFDALCTSHRATADYIELAERFDTLMISDVPQLADGQNDETKRFIHLIDELYDRGVKVVISAACPATELYVGRRLEASFARTTSRLLEMQSTAYLDTVRR